MVSLELRCDTGYMQSMTQITVKLDTAFYPSGEMKALCVRTITCSQKESIHESILQSRLLHTYLASHTGVRPLAQAFSPAQSRHRPGVCSSGLRARLRVSSCGRCRTK